MSHHSFDRCLRPPTDRCPKPANSIDANACPRLSLSDFRCAEGTLARAAHTAFPKAACSSARAGQATPFLGTAESSIQPTDSKPTGRADSAPTKAHCQRASKRARVQRPRNEAMTVAQLSRRSGVESHVVRYYSRRGLLTPVRHPDNHYRLYCSEHIARLRFIQRAKALGFSLSEIRSFLQDAEGGRSPCPRVRALIANRIEANKRKIDELIALQNRMEDALRRWERLPDHAPEDDSVCYLIESYGEMKASSATRYGA